MNATERKKLSECSMVVIYYPGIDRYAQLGSDGRYYFTADKFLDANPLPRSIVIKLSGDCLDMYTLIPV